MKEEGDGTKFSKGEESYERDNGLRWGLRGRDRVELRTEFRKGSPLEVRDDLH